MLLMGCGIASEKFGAERKTEVFSMEKFEGKIKLKL
jgi:hypothetical protein